jgi:hypothetical protein
LKTLIYTGYPLGRIAGGIIRIQARHALRITLHGEAARRPANHWQSEENDIRIYLLTFGLDVPGFRARLDARTRPGYTDRLIRGSIHAKRTG